MKTDLTKEVYSAVSQSISEVDCIDGSYKYFRVDLFDDKMDLDVWFRIVGSSIDSFDYKLYDEDGNWIGKQLTKAERDEIISAIESYTAPIIENKIDEKEFDEDGYYERKYN